MILTSYDIPSKNALILGDTEHCRDQILLNIYRVSQFKLHNHVGVMELVETNKKAHVYILYPIVKIGGTTSS